MESFPQAGLGISQPPRSFVAPYLFSPGEAWRAQTARQTSILSEGPSGTVFRADAFRQIGGFGSRFHTSDSEMNFRMALEHPILLLPDGLWWYRIHDDQISKTAKLIDMGPAETVIWFRELLAHPRNPLMPQERARLGRKEVRGFWRLVLRRVRQGRFIAAFQLWRFARLPLRTLPLAFSSIGPEIPGVPIQD
jgi:hypothetical protein